MENKFSIYYCNCNSAENHSITILEKIAIFLNNDANTFKPLDISFLYRKLFHLGKRELENSFHCSFLILFSTIYLIKSRSFMEFMKEILESRLKENAEAI